jgi:hypothetical protein
MPPTLLRLPSTLLRAALHGAIDLEETAAGIRPRRLGAAARRRAADDGVIRAADDTSGVTIRLVTAASRLDLEATVALGAERGRQPRFAATFLAEVAGEIVDRVDVLQGAIRRIRSNGSMEETPGERTVLSLTLGGDESIPRTVVIHLPHTAATLLHGVWTSAPATIAPPQAGPRWLHHGSSISHGHEADGPLAPWAQRVARRLGFNLTDLALAGNAMLDPFVADTIAASPADLISLKVGINIVGGDAMRTRTLIPALHGFLDRIRAEHPTTPLLVITPISCPIHETVPGPTRARPDGGHSGTPQPDNPSALTLEMARNAIESVVAARATDTQLFLLDGRELLGPADIARLVDDVHPDDAGHALMADRFARLAALPLSPVGRALASAGARDALLTAGRIPR